jgi:hypothetical protein
VLLAGAPVWAQHDADGRWRIYRAGARTSRLGTLPAVGVKHYVHPVSLSASASWLTVDDSAAFVQDGVDDRRVDRLLVVRVGHHLTQLVGCGYGASSCDSPSVCQPLYGPTQSGWSASTGGGTLAWAQFCADGNVDVFARSATGGPLLLMHHLDLNQLPEDELSAAIAELCPLWGMQLRNSAKLPRLRRGQPLLPPAAPDEPATLRTERPGLASSAGPAACG